MSLNDWYADKVNQAFLSDVSAAAADLPASENRVAINAAKS
jgi:hypothetical protein